MNFSHDLYKCILKHVAICSISNYKNNKILLHNDKFLATKLNLFDGDVILLINPYAAVCSDGSEEYISILDRKNDLSRIYFPDCRNIKEIFLSENKEYAFAIYSNMIIVYDVTSNIQIYKIDILEPKNVVLNDNTLYFMDTSENTIHVRDFSPDIIKKEKVNFLTNLQTKRFYAIENSKFVIVKHTSTTDEIYCNSEKLCDIPYNSENCNYNVIYDEISKFWLVINTEGCGIVINSRNGSYDQIHIRKDVGINDFEIENITFNKGNIYIPSQECLYIINTINNFSTKKMKCNKIMTSDSKVYNITNEGFCIMADDTLYEVRKG